MDTSVTANREQRSIPVDDPAQPGRPSGDVPPRMMTYCTSEQMDLWRQVFAEADHQLAGSPKTISFPTIRSCRQPGSGAI
jgi:hypothetical protein